MKEDKITKHALKQKDADSSRPRFKHDMTGIFLGQRGDYDIYLRQTPRGAYITFRYGNRGIDHYTSDATKLTKEHIRHADTEAVWRRNSHNTN